MSETVIKKPELFPADFANMEFQWIVRKKKDGTPYLVKLYRDHFIHLRVKGWSIEEIMNGEREGCIFKDTCRRGKFCRERGR